MDPDQRSSSGRKVKFAPKSPPIRKPKLPATKTEANDEQNEDSAQAQALLRRWNLQENLASGSKVEKKSSVEVTFGPGNSSPFLRKFSIPRGVDIGTSSGSASKYFANEQIGLRRCSGATEDQNDICTIDVTDDTTNAAARKIKREYKEPWDYQHSYYPTTLPLRRPSPVDPEILDEEEFGEAAANVEYDENAVNPAAELGLLERSEQQRMLFFQLPALPLVNQSVISNKGKEKIGTSTVSGKATKSKGSSLEELSKGHMGKMLVFKSGAIKLKLGETLFDVSPGTHCTCAQDIVVVNTEQKHCCVLGELGESIVVTPDV